MWEFPGEKDGVADRSADTPVSEDGVAPVRSSERVGSDSDLRKKNDRPVFETEYPDSITTSAVYDHEWPVKEPMLELTHSFGWSIKRKDNVQVLSDSVIVFVSGGIGVIHNVFTNAQCFIQPSVGNAIRQIVLHPSRTYIAVAEKGPIANVNVFEYPSLRLVVRLRCDGDKDLAYIHFNKEGSHLLTVSPAPNYILTVWDWENEFALCRARASTNYPISRAKFSYFHSGQIVTSGIDHIKFWTYQSNEQGWQISCVSGKFGSRATSTMECFASMALGSVITASTDGTCHKWVDGEIDCEVNRVEGDKLHDGLITNMFCHGRDLITMGTDGFIKIWSWDQLEGPVGPDGLIVESIFRIQMPPGSVPVHMARLLFGDEADTKDTQWLVLDEKGIVWKIRIQLAQTQTPEPPAIVCYTHCGAVTCLTGSPVDHTVVTTGEDGNVRVFSNDTRQCIAVSPGKGVSCTTLIWIHVKVALNLKMLSVGYADGTIKTLVISDTFREPKDQTKITYEQPVPQLYEMNSRRMQTADILQLDLNEDFGILGSISADSTIFLMSLKSVEGVPLALYKIKGPTTFCWQRFSGKCEMVGLIGNEVGQAYQLTLPSTPQENTLMPPPTLVGQQDDRSLKLLTDQPHQLFDFKTVKAKLQPMEPDTPVLASKVTLAVYDPLEADRFWLSMSDYDSGYMYKCAFGGEPGPQEPLESVRIDALADLSVRHMKFLDKGHMLLTSTIDGQIQFFILRTRFVINSIISSWKFKVHDGNVTGVHLSKDNNELYSSGADGSVLSFKLRIPDTAQALLDRRFFKDILFTMQNTKLDDEEERELEEFLREDVFQREQSERERSTMIDAAETIQKEIRAIMIDSETLPESLRMTENDFVIHKDVRATVEGDSKRRVADARNHQIAERVRGRIIQQRLLKYLQGDREKLPEVKLRAFDGSVSVSTYWVQKIEEDLIERVDELKSHLHDEYYASSVTHSDDPMDDDHEQGTEKPKPVEAAEEQAPAAPLALVDDTSRKAWERRRYEEHLARSRRRRREWRELLNRKPDVSEENADFLTSERKRISGQEYKIKQNVRQAIQFMADYMKCPQVELEFFLVRLEIHKQKTKFNGRVLAMRLEKQSLVQRLREIEEELHTVHRKIPDSLRKLLRPVYDLQGEEQLDQCPPPTRDECMRVYEANLEETRKDKMPASVKDRGNIPEPIGDPEENAEWEKKHKFARLQSFATRQTRASMLRSMLPEGDTEQSSPWDELTYDMSEEEKQEQERQLTRLLDQQDKLIKQANTLRLTFDGKLNLMRHDKFDLDIEVKRAELQLFVLKWEHKILGEYEEKEGVLIKAEQKLLTRKDVMEKKIRHIEPDIRALQERLKGMKEVEEKIKADFDAQVKQVTNQKRFRKFLGNIFYHNIKGHAADASIIEEEGSRNCVYQIDATSGPQLECSVSSMEFPSKSRLSRTSVRWTRKLRKSSRLRKPKSHSSLAEFDVNDIFTCPRDLEKKIFQAVHALNKQNFKIRREIEEEIAHNHDVTAASFEAKEELSFIEFELSDVSEKLRDMRLEKFNRWKEIPFPVNIRMDQIQFSDDRIPREDLFNSLIFDEKDLNRLANFIDQVRIETANDIEQLDTLKQEYEKIVREQVIYTTRIDALREECRTIMTQKLGGLIDLDMADSVRVDPQIQEIKDKLEASQQDQDKLLGQFKQQAVDLKIELTRTRAETTEHLKTIANQMAERDMLVRRAHDRTEKIGRGVLENVTTEDLREHQEKLMMWQTMAETQAAEIEALETEISIFKKKDADVSILMHILERRYKGPHQNSDEPASQEAVSASGDATANTLAASTDTGINNTTLPLPTPQNSARSAMSMPLTNVVVPGGYSQFDVS